MFKSSRCRLFGWKLHHVDQQRLENHAGPELALHYLPVCLYLYFPEATWIENRHLGAGVAKLKPTSLWGWNRYAVKDGVNGRAGCVRKTGPKASGEVK